MLKLAAAFAIGAGTALALSWGYILSLKAKIRFCMNFIQGQIDKYDPGTKPQDHIVRDDPKARGSMKPSRAPIGVATLAQSERIAMEEKPQLIVSKSRGDQAMKYICSHCGKVFPLSDELSPKEAVAGIYRRFKEHVESTHNVALPESAHGSGK